MFAVSKKKQVEIPNSWGEAFAGIERMRGRGLKRLRHHLGEILETGIGPKPEVLETLRSFNEIVDRWSIKDTYFETEQEHFRRKFFGRRRLLYRQTVKWLAGNYSALFWKENLKLGKLATMTKQASRATQPALRESNKYRHWTSLHLFRVFVKETSRERPGWLWPGIDVDPWPLKCDRCGAPITSGSSDLMLTCEQGHSRDRDERSASGLLPDLPVAAVGTPISIPKHLKECIVLIK